MSSSLSFRSYSPPKDDPNPCPVCLSDFAYQEKDVVAHVGGGETHPIHKKCAMQWANREETCVNCREPIVSESLYESENIEVLDNQNSQGYLKKLGTFVSNCVRNIFTKTHQ